MRILLALAIAIAALARGAVAVEPPPCGWDTTGCYTAGAWTFIDGDEKITVNQVCTEIKSKDVPWCLLPAYRKHPSGLFEEGETWVYTDAQSGRSDKECMPNWTYYNWAGAVIEADITLSTTTDESRPWCASCEVAGYPGPCTVIALRPHVGDRSTRRLAPASQVPSASVRLRALFFRQGGLHLAEVHACCVPSAPAARHAPSCAVIIAPSCVPLAASLDAASSHCGTKCFCQRILLPEPPSRRPVSAAVHHRQEQRHHLHCQHSADGLCWIRQRQRQWH
jgi:hypothetical protein